MLMGGTAPTTTGDEGHLWPAAPTSSARGRLRVVGIIGQVVLRRLF